MTSSTRYFAWLLCAAVLVVANAQTRVDLRTQGKSVDFSAVPTKPFRTGTALPATCSVGETFFKTDAPAGKNFYGCTAANKWTLQTEPSPELPDGAGQSGKVLSTDGSQTAWVNLGGDVTGTAGALSVQGLQGRPLSTTGPADGDAVKWNATRKQWEPGVPRLDLGGDASGTAGAAIIKGLQGRAVSAAAPGEGQTLRWSAASNQWEPGSPSTTLSGDASGSAGNTVVRALQGNAVSVSAPADGQSLRWNGTSRQWEPGNPSVSLSGDASGLNNNAVVRGLQGRTVSSATPTDGQGLKWNDGLHQWEPGTPNATLTGDASGPSNSTIVRAIQGHALSASSPLDGQALKWNGTSNRWEPGIPSIALAGDATGTAGSNRVTGLQGRVVSQTAPTSGAALIWNGSTSQWEPATLPASVAGDTNGAFTSTVVQGLQGRSVSPTKPNDGQALVWNGALNQWQPSNVTSTLSGDAGGPAGATVVKGLQGRFVAAALPSDGQGLRWNATANQWEPGAPNTVLAGDASGTSGSITVKGLQGRAVASALPEDGQALTWNAASAQWAPSSVTSTLDGDAGGPASATVVKGLQGRPVAALAPADGDGLKWNQAQGHWEPGTTSTVLAGDASGPSGSITVKGLQGRTLAAASPTDGQALKWNAALGQWEPGGPTTNYSAAFTSQTNLVIPGSAHGYRTTHLLVECYDLTDALVEPNTVSVDNVTFDLMVTFTEAQSGSCVVHGGAFGTSGGGGGGTSAVASIFGRTGVVTGQFGDYGFPQIAGTVANSQLPVGIDAGKIGPGTVSSATYGYLANVRSDIQTQIDGRALTAHSHVTGGDVQGDVKATVVTAIQNQPVAATPASDGQVLAWNAGTGRWEPKATSAAGGGLATLEVRRTSGTKLTIGATCSAVTPCNVRIGDDVESFQSPSSVTITAGSGVAYIYVDQDGILSVGHSLTLACSGGCQAAPGITGFPNNAIPIAAWNATNGTWDPEGTDWRAWLSAKVLDAGPGIMTITSGARTTVAVDTAVVPTYVSGSATLDFPSIADRTCSSNMNFTVSGALPGDTVAPGWPGTLPYGLFGTMFVSAVDTVSARLCNLSGITVDPATAKYSATIIRSF